MTKKQFRDALETLSLTQGQAAAFLGLSIRAVHGYANGDPIPKHVAMLLRLMIRLGIDPAEVD